MERSDVLDLILMNQIALAATRDGIEDGDIPVWLLVLVLIRLPPKLIFRFKCVCKQWLSIISNPSFVRFYCSQASLLHPWTFVPSHMQFDGSESSHPPDPKSLADIYSGNFEWPSLHILSLPSFEQPYGKNYEIYGVSNGLVLYGPLEYNTAIVRLCNPVTGQFITLPPHVLDGEGWDSWGLIANVDEDRILVSYVAVHFYVPFQMESSKVFQGEVFLSELGEWKTHDVHMDMAIHFNPTSACVNLNGIFHWLSRRTWLIAYDPCKHPDQARIMTLPGEGTSMNCIDYLTVSHQGQLTYYQQHDGPEDSCSLSIWVLNDYSSGGWFLQHRVNHIDIQFTNTRLSEHEKPICPLSVHPYDSDILYFGYNDMLVSYNLKTERLEIDVDFGDVLDDISLAGGWLAMIVFPPWPVSLSRPALKD